MRLCSTLLAVALAYHASIAAGQYNPRNATPPIPPPPALQPATVSSNLPASRTVVYTNSPAITSAPIQPAIAPARSTAMPESMEKIDDKRKLLTGDVINYRVIEDQDPPRSLPINDSGEIEVPYIGRIPAAGKTLRKLADEIKVLLEKDYYYQASVLLSMDMMNRVRGKIYVVGQVHGPGGQDIPTDEIYTVSKAILRAGGFGDFADKRKVKLVRKNSPDSKETTTTIVDCVEVFEKGDTTNDPVVQAEDIIIVPQRLINF